MNKLLSIVLHIFLVIFAIALFVIICWAALWVGQWLYGIFGLGGMMLLCTYIICLNFQQDKNTKKGR